MKNLLKIIVASIFTITLILFFNYCGSSKKLPKPEVSRKSPVKKEKVVVIPCGEYKSDKKFYRATGNGRSGNLSMARDKALLDAQQRLARLVNSKLKNVMEVFRNEREFQSTQEFEAKTESITRSVTEQSLKDITVICETPTTFNDEDGRQKYNTYIALEMSKEVLFNNANASLSKDEKLKIDYDQKKFREVFDKEMGQLEEEQSQAVEN